MLKRLRYPFLAFSVAAAIGASVVGVVYRYEDNIHANWLDRQLSDYISRVEGQVQQLVAVLESSRAYLMSPGSGELTRERFSSYYQRLSEGGLLSGVQGLGIAQLVTLANEAEVQARLQRGYGPSRTMWPPHNQDLAHRSAIVVLEPADARNLAAIGYDMYSEPVRRAAMDKAYAEGRTAMTAPLMLVQEITAQRQVGTILYLYVSPPRGAGPGGFIYAPLRMGHYIGLPADLGQFDIAIRAYDAEMPEILFHTDPRFEQMAQAGREAHGRRLEIAGRSWQIEAQDARSGTVLARFPMTALATATVLCLAFAVAAAVQGLAAAYRNTRALTALQAQRLSDKDLYLHEMKHRLKNVLARVVAITRQAARHPGSREEFVGTLIDRLAAMAKAQDLLTRSPTGDASLRSLIETELHQIHGVMRDPLLVIEGPEIMVEGRSAQSLGLTFHELATNTLKYGAGADPEGRLHIRWEVQPDGQLRIDWHEFVHAAAVVPGNPGFGSKLIDSCVRLELGGTVTREFLPDGLKLTLLLPYPRRDPIA